MEPCLTPLHVTKGTLETARTTGRLSPEPVIRCWRRLPSSSVDGVVEAAVARAWCSRILHEGPLMLKTIARCMRRSRIAAATTASPRIPPHSGSPRLVVTIVE